MLTSTLLTALFAGCALSSPLVKRDLEIDTVYDVVTVTEQVTETAGAASATVAEVVTTTAASTVLAQSFYKNRVSWSADWTRTRQSSSSSAAVVSLIVSSAEPTSTSSSVQSVAPTSAKASSSSTSVYVASSSSDIAATSSAAETTSAAAAAATTYQERVLVHHNVHRANHSASALTWSSSLANTAASIAATCVYAHNVTANGGGYGQNIAAGVKADNISAVITDLFYNGEVNYFNGLYGQANPDMTNFENWGHFSQIVWKSTTQVGCATYDCSSSGLANVGQYVSPYFTVCNYASPGNYGGEYADNIGDSLNRATVEWNYGL